MLTAVSDNIMVRSAVERERPLPSLGDGTESATWPVLRISARPSVLSGGGSDDLPAYVELL
jgi:hypothetical protein